MSGGLVIVVFLVVLAGTIAIQAIRRIDHWYREELRRLTDRRPR